MAVSKRTRYEVLRRDNYTCRYCRSADNPLTVDHVTHVALGGTDDPSNLVAACKDCNAGKASSAPDATMVADVAEDAIRWAAALRVAAKARARQKAARRKYVATFDEAWRDWHYGGDIDNKMPRPSAWEQSVWKFYELGLPIDDLTDAVRIACGNDRIRVDETWRYMCGVAWKMLTELQEAASQVVSTDGA